MGIQGLLPFVRSAAENIHIRKYCGKQVAIDTYCWIHRGCFACADKLAKKEKTDQYVKYCMKYIAMLESYDVKPILVFDGCRLPSKELVEQQRHKRRKENLEKGRQLLREGNNSGARDCFTKCISVTSAMALEVMQAARAKGVDCIVAPYEADAQLAFFSKYNHVEAVITEDSDLLCFGCKKVIFKMDTNGRGQEICLENLGMVKNLVGFTPDLFRHMCILSGCDYLPSIKGVGLVKSCKALKLSKSKDTYQVARKLHQYIKGIPPVEASYGPEFERADKTFLYQLVYDPFKRKLKPLNDYPPGCTAEDFKYAGSEFPNQQALQLALGNIDVNTKKVMGNFDILDWVRSRKSLSKLPSIWAKSTITMSKFLIKDTTTFEEPEKKSSPVKRPQKKEAKVETVVTYNASDALLAVSENAGLPDADEDETIKTKEIPKNMVKTEIDLSELSTLAQSYTPTTKLSRPKKQIVKSRFFSKPNDVVSKSPKVCSFTDFLHGEDKIVEMQLNNKKTPSVNSQNDCNTGDEILDEILGEINDNHNSPIKRKNPFSQSSLSSKKSRTESLLLTSPQKKKKLFKPAIAAANLSTTADSDFVDAKSPKKRASLPEYLVGETKCGKAGIQEKFHILNASFETTKNIASCSQTLEETSQSDDIVSSLKSNDTDITNLSNNSQQHEISPRVPLAVLPEPNGHKDKISEIESPQTFTVSSDEELESQKNSPVSTQKVKRTLGLDRNVDKSKKSLVSKYFVTARASGLRKPPKSQPSIANFFKKI